MIKVLLFGATGHAGKEIARELKERGYHPAVVVRSKAKADQLSAITTNYIVADITNESSLTDICKGYDVVISALGKSVSLNDKSRPSFNDIDFLANAAILKEAKNSGVKKFVYLSAFQSECYQHLEYFKAHHNFSEKLKQSGINYSIIKPPAIFSAFIDLIKMAEKGRLMNVGNGDKMTNPIHEADLATICVNSIKENNITIEAGGPNIYSRKQLNEIIQNETNPGKKLRSFPMGLFKMLLPLVKLISKNRYDKFAFFAEVLQHDTIAPQTGKQSFEAYIKMKAGR